MAAQMIDEITKMAIRHTIELMEEIYAIVKDKQCATWENDSDRFLVSEKIVKLVVYLKLCGLLEQIDILKDFDNYMLLEDDCFKLRMLQLNLPLIINMRMVAK